MSTKNLYKGTIETFIYQLLQENEKMYGYEISKKIKDITQGNLNISESKLYPALHKLEASGHLTTEIVNIGKRVRKYYSLTKDGKKEAKIMLSELTNYIDIMKSLLNPKLSTI